jgi:hypothetical protein
MRSHCSFPFAHVNDFLKQFVPVMHRILTSTSQISYLSRLAAVLVSVVPPGQAATTLMAVKEDEPRSPGTEGARYQSNETSSFGPTVGNGSSDGSNKATPDSSRKASEHSQSADATGAQRAAEEAANRAQQAASQARKHMTQAAKRTTEFVQAVAGEMFSRAQPGQGSQEKAGGMMGLTVSLAIKTALVFTYDTFPAIF